MFWRSCRLRTVGVGLHTRTVRHHSFAHAHSLHIRALRYPVVVQCRATTPLSFTTGTSSSTLCRVWWIVTTLLGAYKVGFPTSIPPLKASPQATPSLQSNLLSYINYNVNYSLTKKKCKWSREEEGQIFLDNASARQHIFNPRNVSFVGTDK